MVKTADQGVDILHLYLSFFKLL